MATPVVLEAIPLAEPVAPHLEDAARLLEQALQAGGGDPQVAYMLAMAHKRLGKVAEARTALRKIARPNANVLLQMGLLSLQERQFPQAEEELARAWQADPGSYEAGYNLLLTRLALGQLESCVALLPAVVELAPNPGEQRFLRMVLELLRGAVLEGARTPDAAGQPFETALADITAADELRLLHLLRGMDRFEVIYPLFQALAAQRPRSAAAQEANFEAALVQGKRLMDRCDWGAATRLLAPLARSLGEGRPVARPTQAALLNLLGCCAAMEQDFPRAAKLFTSALRLAANDVRVLHNLALIHEWQDDLKQADPYWNQFFDLLDRRIQAPPGQADYVAGLAFEGLNHLAEAYAKKEKWPAALAYLQRAQKLRPQDADLLERLFHLYHQVKKPEEARRTLRLLRQLKPNDPQLDLYELDLQDTKSLDDIDRKLTDIGRILKKYPNDLRVEERAVAMVQDVIPFMGQLCDQLTDRINQIIDRVRNLPNYQINWSAVREVMRDLEDDFLKLRQITRLCLPLVTNDEHRRIIRELGAHIDKKIDDCRRLGRG